MAPRNLHGRPSHFLLLYCCLLFGPVHHGAGEVGIRAESSDGELVSRLLLEGEQARLLGTSAFALGSSLSELRYRVGAESEDFVTGPLKPRGLLARMYDPLAGFGRWVLSDGLVGLRLETALSAPPRSGVAYAPALLEEGSESEASAGIFAISEAAFSLDHASDEPAAISLRGGPVVSGSFLRLARHGPVELDLAFVQALSLHQAEPPEEGWYRVEGPWVGGEAYQTAVAARAQTARMGAELALGARLAPAWPVAGWARAALELVRPNQYLTILGGIASPNYRGLDGEASTRWWSVRAKGELEFGRGKLGLEAGYDASPSDSPFTAFLPANAELRLDANWKAETMGLRGNLTFDRAYLESGLVSDAFVPTVSLRLGPQSFHVHAEAEIELDVTAAFTNRDEAGDSEALDVVETGGSISFDMDLERTSASTGLSTRLGEEIALRPVISAEIEFGATAIGFRVRTADHVTPSDFASELSDFEMLTIAFWANFGLRGSK